MLFKARNKVHFISKIINLLWPRRGWTRLIRYNSLRVKRLPGTPHSISLGFAFGVMAALTPFFGLHFFIGIFFAWVFGASIIASIIGNFIGNPWTFPFICIVNFKIGSIFYVLLVLCLVDFGSMFDGFGEDVCVVFVCFFKDV